LPHSHLSITDVDFCSARTQREETKNHMPL
jgi:hypothetical protein